MTDGRSPVDVGDVVPRVAAVMREAQYAWQVRTLSWRSFAAYTDIAVNTLRLWVDGTAQRYALRTLAHLCWYFGCGAGHLLTYVPPGAASPLALQHGIVQRTNAPRAPLPDPALITVENHVPALLATHSHSAIAAATGIHRHTIRLAQHGEQLNRHTLAALCWYLRCGIDELFTVRYPLDV